MRVLVVNAGSSSLKLSLIDEHDETLAERELAAVLAGGSRDAPAGGEGDRLRAALLDSPLRECDAVAHRIVHGGERFREAVLVDAEVERELDQLAKLAPLHQPRSLAALRAVGELLPERPAVACFDTAFHATLPPAAYTYALPARWRERWQLRRYGFHGLSHAWVARRASELLGDHGHGRGREGLRIVSCHLGAGASLCAIEGGRSLDTTMGFTPLEGLVMATRSGSVDPGMLLWLEQQEGVSPVELAEALEQESGLLGLAGSADMRTIIERSAAGEPDASLALDVYVHRLRAGIAAMAAALEGLDALVFTGGVGERAPVVRARALEGLGFLGVRADQSRNHDASGEGGGDAQIGAEDAPAATLVLRAREDLEMARQARAVLGGA